MSFSTASGAESVRGVLGIEFTRENLVLVVEDCDCGSSRGTRHC